MSSTSRSDAVDVARRLAARSSGSPGVCPAWVSGNWILIRREMDCGEEISAHGLFHRGLVERPVADAFALPLHAVFGLDLPEVLCTRPAAQANCVEPLTNWARFARCSTADLAR